MTAEWSTARLEDFIPFIPEVYVRLTERINETFWPLHLVGLLLGLGWTMFPGLRGSRWTGVPWAIVWVWVGTVYHLQHYTNLHWAGTILAAGFYLQALLMLLLTSPSGARTLRLSDRASGPEWSCLWLECF